MAEVEPGLQIQPGFTIVYDNGFPRKFHNFHMCKNTRGKTFLTDLKHIFKVIQTTSGPKAFLSEETKIGNNDEYTVTKKIGNGSFGTVFQVKDSENKFWVVKMQRMTSGLVEELYIKKAKEVSNVVELKESYVYNEQHLMIMKEYSGCFNQIGERTSCEWIFILKSLLTTLAELHEKHIIHCDIKPDNIFMDGDVPVLGDFGLADIEGNKGGLIVSWYYRHFEICQSLMNFEDIPSACRSKAFIRKSSADIWALGTTMFYAITGKKLFIDCGEYSKKFFFHDEKQLYDAIRMEMECPGGITTLILNEIKATNILGPNYYKYLLVSTITGMIDPLSTKTARQLLNEMIEIEAEF